MSGADDSIPRVPGFDAGRAGKQAECDGGGAIAGTRYGAREDFRGTLTGDYVDHGDPPWRWYLLKDLVLRPEGYPGDKVWCLAENLFVDGEP